MTRVNIYRVDGIVQAYAKETTSDFKKLQARYKRILRSKRFQAAFPRYRNIELRPGHGWGSYADYGQWNIRLGGNRSEAVLLHEIAHHVARRHPEFGYCDGHGPGFASAYLAVVKVAQGAEAERALRHTYKAIGVKVYSPTKANGVAVRVRGEAPEKVRALIGEVSGFKKAHANERAYARQALAQTEPGVYEQTVICPICTSDCKVVYSTYRTTRRYHQTQVQYEVRCDDCQLHEFGKADPYWFFKRKAAARS